ncbi:MAG TPA: acyl-homoserine-lactone synthase [Hyphomicrobiaceae bacterium]|nr:acyl-homoserine-lactone synthase [Hyphomicrobiaceae bacterium]
MMVLIQGSEADKHSQLIDAMHRLRAKVFGDRLGWAVTVVDGRERDKFDDLNPLYALSLDAADRVVGTFRLLQTTGPTMLGEVFSACLPPGLVIRSPIIWESTRFCVDTELARERGERGLSEVTAELLSSLLEIGLYAGLSHIVTVIDVRMERILRRAGCPIERLAEPVKIGDVPTLAILMECSDETVAHLHQRNGLSEGFIRPETIMRLHQAA